jgi:hypothetical protein
MADKKKNSPAVELVEPVEVLEVECCGKDECEACPFDAPKLEEVESPEPVVEAPKTEGRVFAKEGDSYASIAALVAPSGVSKHDYAKVLFEKNKGKTLRAGVEVIL